MHLAVRGGLVSRLEITSEPTVLVACQVRVEPNRTITEESFCEHVSSDLDFNGAINRRHSELR
jgi:hypothetical protein